MAYWTTKWMLADNLLASIKYVEELEREKRRPGEEVRVVLAGHLSGGQLRQFLFSDGDVKAKALVLIESVLCFGL